MHCNFNRKLCGHSTLLTAPALLIFHFDVISRHLILTPVNLANFANTSWTLQFTLRDQRLMMIRREKRYACHYVDIDTEGTMGITFGVLRSHQVILRLLRMQYMICYIAVLIMMKIIK